MKKRSGFTLMNREEFKTWVLKQVVNRKINMIQNHHTYLPDYKNFDGKNHFEKVKGMRWYHIYKAKMDDIAQQVTTFPDGMIMVGHRSMETPPAGIRGNNDFGICIEHLGNFDKGGDEMTDEHKKTIIFVNAVLNLKFALKPNTDHNVYHHWYNLRSGNRTNGDKNSKSCPGTNFFGGNKVEDAKKHLIPKINKVLKGFPEYKKTFDDIKVEKPIMYAMVVRAKNLNVRSGPGVKHRRMGRLEAGTLVSVFEKHKRWSRISTDDRWVSSYYLEEIRMGVVIDEDPKGLNVRTGPGSKFRKLDALLKGTEVRIHEEKNKWLRIDYIDKWVYGKYVKDLI